METRPKEAPTALQEPRAANPSKPGQEPDRVGGGKLRAEGTVQEVSVQNNLHDCSDGELSPAVTHGNTGTCYSYGFI